MSSLIYRKATLHDALDLAPRMRACDVLELTLATGDPEGALVSSVQTCEDSIVALYEGVPIAIGGCTAHKDFGVPWLLCSPEIAAFRQRLIKDVRPHVERWALQYPTLFNYVHSENVTSIAWLKRLGFTIGAVTPFGASGAPFFPFYRLQRCATLH